MSPYQQMNHGAVYLEAITVEQVTYPPHSSIRENTPYKQTEKGAHYGDKPRKDTELVNE